MKRLTLPLVLICLAGAGRAQLLPDQKLLDFQQLAALYAKQYAPYEWKRDALKIDLLQLSPWLAWLAQVTLNCSPIRNCSISSSSPPSTPNNMLPTNGSAMR